MLSNLIGSLKMDFNLVVALIGIISTAVNSETHTLSYIYTALSKPVELPGIHEFTAMGLLDGRMIDYYDSKIQKKIPKQPWMEEMLGSDYWAKGSTSRQSKEQWFKVNVNILMERMGQTNDTKLHFLQWSHGCEVEVKPGEPVKFVKGTDHYSYDGDDFLSFDDANMRWIAPVPQAFQTKLKWDSVHILNQYTKGYLQKECVDWLNTFVKYGKAQLENAPPPKVHVFAKAAKTPGNVHVFCLATGFYHKDVQLDIRRDKRILNQVDGIETYGVRPNDDDTFQIRKSVEIRKEDKGDFDCYVHHSSLSHGPIVEKWDRTCCDCTTTIITVASITSVIVVILTLSGVAVCFVLYRRGCFVRAGTTDHGSSSSSSDVGAATYNGDKSSDHVEVKLLGSGSSSSSSDVGAATYNGDKSSDHVEVKLLGSAEGSTDSGLSSTSSLDPGA